MFSKGVHRKISGRISKAICDSEAIFGETCGKLVKTYVGILYFWLWNSLLGGISAKNNKTFPIGPWKNFERISDEFL